MTKDRILAAELYDIIEAMVFLVHSGMVATPRREDNKLRFVDFIDRLSENP